MRNTLFAATVTAAILAGATTQGLGCGYHSTLGNSFSALHPRSIEVAVALREAADAGVLDGALLTPKTGNLFGYHRALQRMKRLETALTRAVQKQGGDVTGFAVLLVESSLWTRYERTADGLRAMVHADGPAPQDAVIVTGEAAIAAIESHALTAAEAFGRGIVIVSGDESTVAAARELLETALTREGYGLTGMK